MTLYCLKKSKKSTVVGEKWERPTEDWERKRRRQRGEEGTGGEKEKRIINVLKNVGSRYILLKS